MTLLKERTFDLLLRPAPGETYVNGWGTSTRPWAKGARDGDTGAVFTHAGSNTMWFCVVWVAPEIDFAALVACNAADGDVPKACDRVAGQLVQRFARAAAAWPASR